MRNSLSSAFGRCNLPQGHYHPKVATGRHQVTGPALAVAILEHVAQHGMERKIGHHHAQPAAAHRLERERLAMALVVLAEDEDVCHVYPATGNLRSSVVVRE